MSVENLVGQQLAQYELRELLGAGGMGAVYRAYQTNLTREVAVKTLSAALAAQPDYIHRFNREADRVESLVDRIHACTDRKHIRTGDDGHFARLANAIVFDDRTHLQIVGQDQPVIPKFVT